MVLRFLNKDLNIQHRVSRLMLLAKSMTGEEVGSSRQLITSISTELGIGGERVVAMMHDQASVNSVAMSVLYNNFLDVGCFGHILDLVGKNMKMPVLDKFFKSWVQPFSQSKDKTDLETADWFVRAILFTHTGDKPFIQGLW